MELKKVKSSNIEQIGFEENVSISLNQAPKNILRIVFTSGFTYDYYDVSKEVYEDFLKADSVGKYFHEFIKNDYIFEKK